MLWRPHATSHYLSQCWPRSMSPYGVIGPQCCDSLLNSTYLYESIIYKQCTTWICEVPETVLEIRAMIFLSKSSFTEVWSILAIFTMRLIRVYDMVHDLVSPSQTSGFLQNFLINLDMFVVCSIAWDIWKPWSLVAQMVFAVCNLKKYHYWKAILSETLKST